ncbi:MAG: peptidoglycan-binding protein [Clostridia bacterium]|nr:peptidoglycan-binding protein [Clostridia bacterium]
MKKLLSLILAALLALSLLTSALADIDRETVKAVQQALNDAGYNCGTPDGVAGRKTAAAVSQYQEDNGLEVTGEIDDALLAALGLAAEAPEDAAEDAAASQADEDETDAVADTGTDEAEADAVADTGTDEADDDAAADTGEGDIPQAPVAANDKIPQELVEATGGLPERLDDLADWIDIEGIIALKTAWEVDGPAALMALMEDGSCELPTYGYDWETIWFTDGNSVLDAPSQIREDSILTITRKSPIRYDTDVWGNKIEYYSLSLRTADSSETTPHVEIGAIKNLEDSSSAIEININVNYGDVAGYSNVIYSIFYRSDDISGYYACVLDSEKHGTQYACMGLYDPSGCLIDFIE